MIARPTPCPPTRTIARASRRCAASARWDAFAAALEAQRGRVTRHFQAVFAEAQENGAGELWQDDREALAQALAARGYRDPAGSAARLAAVRASQRYQNLPKDSRRRFDALAPALAAAAAASADPDATLERGLALIEAIARRAAYLALLAEHPEALERVARIVAASSWAAEFVTRHPLLLDELLDDRVLYAPPDWQAFARALRALIAAHEGDPERQMDVLREQHQAQVFRLLAQDLAGLLTVERLADHLSALADLTLEAALELAWRQVRRHREGAPRFAVVAYGKLGGKELGYASDLDLIFLYDDPDERAAEAYARLAQKLNLLLTTRTAAGVLFATDLRLRPSGASGLLVSTLAAFEQYQEKQAWVWEHQALSRARFCAGDAAIGAAFEAIRERILRRKRDPAELAREVLAMRAKMHAAHPNSERPVRRQARHGRHDRPRVRGPVPGARARARARPAGRQPGQHRAAGIAGELGLIPAELARRGQEAYREFRRVQHALRLGGANYARVPQEQLAGHVRAVRALWATALG